VRALPKTIKPTVSTRIACLEDSLESTTQRHQASFLSHIAPFTSLDIACIGYLRSAYFARTHHWTILRETSSQQAIPFPRRVGGRVGAGESKIKRAIHTSTTLCVATALQDRLFYRSTAFCDFLKARSSPPSPQISSRLWQYWFIHSPGTCGRLKAKSQRLSITLNLEPLAGTPEFMEAR